jgi:hypothetical protein
MQMVARDGLRDHLVGQGGTVANLIGYVESAGGHAIGATVLTGKPYSAKLAPDDELIRALRDNHGRDLENWWRARFGFGFDCLTRSEARYLEKSADAQAIRDRLIEAGLEGSSGSPESCSESVAPSDRRASSRSEAEWSRSRPAKPLQCQIRCQIWVCVGSGGGRKSKGVSNLLILIILPAGSSPSLSTNLQAIDL